jgi:lipopolysaccharide transport system ATP-binding protein
MMSDAAIRVEGLSKCYQLGQRERYSALREALAETMSAPVRRILAALGGGDRRPPNEQDVIWSLKDVSFEVNRGEVVGIIGRNGAGKSTLLKILSRVTEPTQGYAELRGLAASLLEVGTGFHPELTGRENVFLNGAILGMRRAEIQQKFDEIVAFAEVERFLDTPVKHYSSGMYVRLAFAVAAHLESEILLVDEVLAVGDAGFQQKCLGKMGDVAKAGRTVLFVSHNMPAVQALCSRAILLDHGAVLAEGSTGAVVQEYLSSVSRRAFLAPCDLRSLVRDPRMQPVFVEGLVNGESFVAHHTFLPEQALRFELTLELPKPIKQCWVGIHFEDEMGIRVYSLSTRWELGPFDMADGKHEVTCVVDRPPLVPGKYFVSIGFFGEGRQVDWLERVACIEFVQYDVYGTGELPQVYQGYFLSRACWNVSGGKVLAPARD